MALPIDRAAHQIRSGVALAKAKHWPASTPRQGLSRAPRSNAPRVFLLLATMAAPHEEREMTRYQRGLVDTCFEEGQYESGIAVLDQLRSSSLKPSADHIRQLLYIALFPPPPATGDQINHQEQAPPSLAKGSPSKQKHALSKASLTPLVLDSGAAQRILFSFLSTNSPGSLFRALPSYPLNDVADNNVPAGSSGNGHDEDSLIAQESLCIKSCRNCWAILKEGFIQRKKLLPQDASRRRGRGTYSVQDADLDQSCGTPTVVAEHAWPVLEWLLSLFEKDELLNFQTYGEKFSPLLLSQIPPSGGVAGPRWEASVPLDIVFHSVGQEDSERREMASRILSLLINLTLSGSFDGPMFSATLTMRLKTSPQVVQSLMESLPKTVLVLAFKITVCQKFLSSGPSITGGTKPRPRPLPRRGSRRDSEAIPSTTDTSASQAGSSLAPRTALATCSEVFQLLCGDYTSQKSTLAPAVLAIKYSLLVSYAHLQRLLPSGERDSDWKDALSNGGLKHIIDTAFPSDSTYHAPLTIIASFWPAS